ncbi:MAG TPA: Xaa-Pro aminopeptidase [Pyrinomonadaceae bacterium]|nr:Xaa-Pro aminopeptidase [Pyrinomonadaceae bacterium]
MKHSKTKRNALAAAAVALALSCVILAGSRAQATQGATAAQSAASSATSSSSTPSAPAAAVATTLRVAPPAPVITDAERHAELSARRERVRREVGPKSVLVMLGAEPRLYTGDVDYEYRQENNLFYLTHLNQHGARLVLLPGGKSLREILFLPRRNPSRETWNGYMYSAEDARRISGLSEIWDAREFEPFVKALQAGEVYYPKQENVLLSPLRSLKATPTAGSGSTEMYDVLAVNLDAEYSQLFAAAAKNEANVYLLAPERALVRTPPSEAEAQALGEAPEWRQEIRFAERERDKFKGYGWRSAFRIFSEMRLRKSPMELKLLQHAIDITIEGLGRAMGVASRAKWEYEIEAEIEYTFKRRNADQWGYPSIVGCGPNATTLHYTESQGGVRTGELVLMDVGAEYQHYTADLTRTFPVSGKFTKEQAEIYQIVLDAQEAGMRAIKPGATRADVHRAATEVIKDGLLRLGLIAERDGTITVGGLAVPQYRIYFMHGTTHWLGMNVHDVGDGNPVLEPGMVFTNEPGIYVRGDALTYLPKTPEAERFAAAVRPAFEKYKNIGVRIEDDVLVTADGYRNLSVALPRTIADVERFMANVSREVR